MSSANHGVPTAFTRTTTSLPPCAGSARRKAASADRASALRSLTTASWRSNEIASAAEASALANSSGRAAGTNSLLRINIARTSKPVGGEHRVAAARCSRGTRQRGRRASVFLFTMSNSQRCACPGGQFCPFRSGLRVLPVARMKSGAGLAIREAFPDFASLIRATYSLPPRGSGAPRGRWCGTPHPGAPPLPPRPTSSE